MILAYSILSNGNQFEIYVNPNQDSSQIKSKISKVYHKIINQKSKTVRSLSIRQQCSYYFCQQPYTFILLAKNHQKQNRMQNYLRIVADIFYQNQDQKKFKYVLARIIEEINKIQNGQQKEMVQEFQESSLMSNDLVSQKNRITDLVKKQEMKSKRVLYVKWGLILAIALLVFVYFYQRNIFKS